MQTRDPISPHTSTYVTLSFSQKVSGVGTGASQQVSLLANGLVSGHSNVTANKYILASLFSLDSVCAKAHQVLDKLHGSFSWHVSLGSPGQSMTSSSWQCSGPNSLVTSKLVSTAERMCRQHWRPPFNSL